MYSISEKCRSQLYKPGTGSRGNALMSICETQKFAKTNQKLAPASRARRYGPRAAFIAFVLPALAAGLLAMSAGVDQPDIVRTPDPVESLAFSSDGTVPRRRLRRSGSPDSYSAGRGARLQPLRAATGSASSGRDLTRFLDRFRGFACALRWPVFSPTSLIYYGRRRDCAGGVAGRRPGSANSNGTAGALRSDRIPLYDLADGPGGEAAGPASPLPDRPRHERRRVSDSPAPATMDRCASGP